MMLLRNVHIVGANGSATDISIHRGEIAKVGPQSSIEDSIDFGGNHLAFPGLVNSHDHLDFNLFPTLGANYDDYTEWGTDIHRSHKKEIEAVLQIPELLRMQWGVLKNIFNGITTVVDHSRFSGRQSSEYIDTFSDFTYLHSVALEKYWKLKLNLAFRKKPVMIHVGEGKNEKMSDEIDQLIQWNLFRRDLIGVHGIAMVEKQARHFKAAVWCPASNLFLYNKTAEIDRLKLHTHILFGMDSALSASADLWEHLRLARQLGMLSDQELFDSLTVTPAHVFGMKNSKKLIGGQPADIVIAKRKHENMWKSFYELNPEDIMIIIKRGRIIYFDHELKKQMPSAIMDSFSDVYVKQQRKYLLHDMVTVIEALEHLGVQLPLPVSTKA